MVRVYHCKQCKKITVNGYINEFEEHFCSKKCYENYCVNNGYEVCLNNIKPVEENHDLVH